ncbi:MAG: DNA alkylation repair protein [Spirochaetia bacterium]|jgi:3-methyladenine DNA glycosylase AlkD|nr:DNA alkylation repair protein [Spirochaetia bacterium]
MSHPSYQTALDELESLGKAAVKARYRKESSDLQCFGVQMGDIRKLAKEFGTDHGSDHELALALWESPILEARLLAVLLMKPDRLGQEQLDAMVRSATTGQLADWLNAYIVRKHLDTEQLRRKWMSDADPWAARAGWSLTSERVESNPEGLDLAVLLNRIESEMATAAPPQQWTMNFCLAAIGINHPEFRQRAIAIGESLGIYRDYPTPKGCTSPFAPVWIKAMVDRQK